MATSACCRERPDSRSARGATHGRLLNGRAIDFAKFGQLFLDFGTWDGEQIVSPAWVEESTSPDPSDDRPWLIDHD